VTRKEASEIQAMRKELEALRVICHEFSRQVIQDYENHLSARGRKGARALAKKLGAAGRHARAQKAAAARWSKRRAQ